MSRIVERVSLFYREGGSDKVYVIALAEEAPGEFRVTGYNGRRGRVLTAQPKTPEPVSYSAARSIFNSLEHAKRNHPQTPYQVAERQTDKSAFDRGTNADGKGELLGAAPVAAPTTDATPEQQQQPHSPEAYRANHLDALEL